MLQILASYVVTILVKWGWEAGDWLEEQRNGDGVKGLLARWWMAHRLALFQKGLLHIFLFVGWYNDALTPLVNKMVQVFHSNLMDEGIATVPPQLVSSVTWLTTIPAALILDTFGKPIAKRLLAVGKALTSSFTNKGAPAAP